MAPRKTFALACATVLLGLVAGFGTVASAQVAPRHLSGTYSVTGTTICVASLVGFTGLDPIVGPGIGRWTSSWSVEAVATFNANGTGTATGRTVGITHPDEGAIGGGGGSSEFQETFTYVLGPGNTITMDFTNITGTELTGDRAGQTFTLTAVQLVGHVGVNERAITGATAVPNIETVAYSLAPSPVFRLCHRSRVFIRG